MKIKLRQHREYVYRCLPRRKNCEKKIDTINFFQLSKSGDLASMLGVTRETVNRELMKLRHQGILVKDKKRIIVKDIARLLDII